MRRMNEFASVLVSVLLRTWEFTEEAAPWLLLGFLFAGILKAFVPSELLLKYLGTGRLRSIFIATFVGIPLPLCSCGVIPTGLSLYERGASKASTLAFFIATPATTVTALFLTFGMLGWRFAIAEITASFAVAIATGTLAGFVSKERGVLEADGGDAARDINVETHVGRIETVLRYGFVDMVGDVGLYILAGLFGAGMIAALVPSSAIERYFGGALSPIIMVLLTTPMYICSTASVPFVASLIEKGMLPCAGLVVLIAGPATNLSTMFAVGKVMGKKTAVLYVASIVFTTVLISYGFHLVGFL